MEDIVAVEVRFASGNSHYCLTWGRIQSNIDPHPLAELVLRHASPSQLDGSPPVSARVLWSLHPAMTAPYFFEYFFEMSQKTIPRRSGYKKWRRNIAEQMDQGKEMWWLGEWVISEQPDEPDATTEAIPETQTD
jgi:hypothetical protein